MKRPTFLIAAALSLLWGAALTAVLYLADQIADLSFAPYILFDWVATILPGDVITKVIDTMVEVIERGDLGETSSTAKTIEHISGIGLFLGLATAAGIGLAALLRRRDRPAQGAWRYGPGLALGLIAAVPLILIAHDVLYAGDTVTAVAPEQANAAWLIAALAAWGAALNRTFARLQDLAPAADTSADAADADRRRFLVQVGGATAALTVVGAGLGRYLVYRDDQQYQERIKENRAAAEDMPDALPNADASVQPAPGTRPEYTPLEDHYRIDINSEPPIVNEDEWRLAFTGLVQNPVQMTLDELKNGYAPLDQYVTLACISNRIGGDLTSTTRWTGASLRDVLADVGLQPEATHLKITTADNRFFEIVDLELVDSDPRIMLCYAWDGIPLLHKHGFPLRIYIPDLYGMKQPKWITQIEVMDHYEDGFWVERSWDRVAQMRATSVVDVAAADRTFEQDGVTYVPVGGIAHAGARGISKVEVRVDEGEWREAQLREPLSDTTWVIWRYDWPFEAGDHTFAVRCYDGTGEMQIVENNPPKPSGATGIHRLRRNIA